MDAVIQAEAADVRAIVTNTCVIIFEGLMDDSLASVWVTVFINNLQMLENSISSNAPNSSLILV